MVCYALEERNQIVRGFSPHTPPSRYIEISIRTREERGKPGM